jgi:hypothetical protein
MKIVGLLFWCFLFFVANNLLLQDKTSNFKWPNTYQVDITRKYKDPKTDSTTTMVPQYRYVVSGLKARNGVLTKSGMEITIFRIDQKKMYSFTTSSKVYHVSKSSASEISKPFDDSGSWIFQSKEKLNNAMCNKYIVTPSINGNKTVEPFFVWLDCVSRSPARVRYASGIEEEYSNYISGPIPDSAFEVPNDYINWEDIPTLKKN